MTLVLFKCNYYYNLIFWMSAIFTDILLNKTYGSLLDPINELVFLSSLLSSTLECRIYLKQNSGQHIEHFLSIPLEAPKQLQIIADYFFKILCPFFTVVYKTSMVMWKSGCGLRWLYNICVLNDRIKWRTHCAFNHSAITQRSVLYKNPNVWNKPTEKKKNK